VHQLTRARRQPVVEIPRDPLRSLDASARAWLSVWDYPRWRLSGCWLRWLSRFLPYVVVDIDQSIVEARCNKTQSRSEKFRFTMKRLPIVEA
jgi:hypothetical protein